MGKKDRGAKVVIVFFFFNNTKIRTTSSLIVHLAVGVNTFRDLELAKTANMVSLQLGSPDYFHSEVKINCMKKLFLFNRQVAHRDKGFLDAVQTRLSREEPAKLRAIRRAFINSL